ncbi:MAG: hypothetical protein JST04_01060 [Bdellovibrionales bacterium]|nr:hypothetical protein [Bdellovibrionales bacterium]
MTVQEIHIEIDLALQDINSNRREKFFSEEKDWLFNLATRRFISQRINPKSNPKGQGFQSTIKRYQDLDQLLVPSSIPLYYLDDNTSYGILPQNCHEVIEESGIRPLLARTDCGLRYSDFSLINIDRSVCPVLFPQTTQLNGNTLNAFKGFKILMDNTVIYDTGNYPALVNGLTDTDLYFTIIDQILREVNKRTDVEVRWEQFNDHRYDFSLIFVSLGNNSFNTISYQYTSNVGTSPVTVVTNAIQQRYQEYNIPNTVNRIERPSRVIKTADYLNTIYHPHWKPTWQSPIVHIENGLVKVPHQKRFISNTLNLTYIRKPNKINLSLNQGSDFGDSVISEIISNMVTDIIAKVDPQLFPVYKNQDNFVE